MPNTQVIPLKVAIELTLNDNETSTPQLIMDAIAGLLARGHYAGLWFNNIKVIELDLNRDAIQNKNQTELDLTPIYGCECGFETKDRFDYHRHTHFCSKV